MPFDHAVYFASVRDSLFSGVMTESQVAGQQAILRCWEDNTDDADVRWLAYMLATTYHETATEMQPIKEYGKGAGQPYGEIDAETGQTYYGRGFVQLTWRDNYRRADDELGLAAANSCEWHADNALKPSVAAAVLLAGMYEGWFRGDDDGPQTLDRYFNLNEEDPFNAREIVNGDKNVVPSWSDGASIGSLITDYYVDFLVALVAAG
jgi:hypothetical protein